MPFRSYLVEEGGHQLHVFYCHWEDRGQGQGFQRTHLTYGTRLEHVLAGRRHLGQRSLELIFSGLPKERTVEEVIQAQLEKLVRVAEPPAPGRPMPAICICAREALCCWLLTLVYPMLTHRLYENTCSLHLSYLWRRRIHRLPPG
ncbi:MAG: hypothetical protein NTW03_20260 [Verrucomicrobia bacterium]|nr:hypothetical protein [Verrucomicrobiota bacterium]